jgi:hypothetical protein
MRRCDTSATRGMFVAWEGSSHSASEQEEGEMPEKETLARANRARRGGKSASTQAGEFVREEIEHIRAGKHGARSTKQAIAIGLSKARRAGVRLKPPAPGKTSEKTRQSAERAYEAGAHPRKRVSRVRSRAVEAALQRESQSTVSHRALAEQTHRAARQRTATDRSAAAQKAARTKGPGGRAVAARKAAATRARRATG